MFPLDRQFTGKKIDKNYVEQRAKSEPLYEITQIKGDGETHPFLSTEDEFADYETWDSGNLDLSEAKSNDMLAREYAREALKTGFQLEKKFGTNPYKFGVVGSTDSHTSLGAVEEENFFGKSAGAEPSPKRMEHPFMKSDKGVFEGYQMVASGYAAVWAEENTREALYSAFRRKETFATTGPRIKVRFFASNEFEDGIKSNDRQIFKNLRRENERLHNLLLNDSDLYNETLINQKIIIDQKKEIYQLNMKQIKCN